MNVEESMNMIIIFLPKPVTSRVQFCFVGIALATCHVTICSIAVIKCRLPLFGAGNDTAG